MTELAQRKDAARKQAFARRKEAHRPGNHCAALLAQLEGVKGAVISAYLPIRTEIDPLPALHALADHNRLCVPVILGAGQPLMFHEWTPEAVLVPGPFNVLVPKDGIPLTPDIVIAPLLAFDAQCFRLGYGGGFYDRTLQKLRADGAVTAYGFAYAAQQVADLPLEPTDQPLDAIITETATLWR